MTNVSQDIKIFIESEFKLEKGSIGVDDDLFKQGILDSMAVLQIVNFIEESHNIQIKDEEIVVENFRSVTAITSLINRKTEKQGT